ncbi:hypothetical protein V6N13_140149 [Hibiscus sabdariffa]|uniref:Transmembrane protein n=2 Tax=Hibiscus sabdariffa TaxID=183260 RepID=A0ABR2QBC8_9ROSI
MKLSSTCIFSWFWFSNIQPQLENACTNTIFTAVVAIVSLPNQSFSSPFSTSQFKLGDIVKMVVMGLLSVAFLGELCVAMVVVTLTSVVYYDGRGAWMVRLDGVMAERPPLFDFYCFLFNHDSRSLFSVISIEPLIPPPPY